MYSSLLLLMAAGIVAEFMGRVWGSGWIWASLGFLICMTAAMWLFASPYYAKVRKAVGLPYFQGAKGHSPEEPASPGEPDALLASRHPMLLTVIGVGGLLLILWPLKFKPF